MEMSQMARRFSGRPRWLGRWSVALFALVVAAASAGDLTAAGAVRSHLPASGAGFSCRDTLTRAKSGPTFSLTATIGATRVAFHATRVSTQGLPRATDGSLAISFGSKRWTVPTVAFADGSGLIANPGGDQLCLLRVAAGLRPSVLLQSYSGGAHCCFLPVLYTYAKTSDRYRLTARATLTESGSPVAALPPYNPNGGVAPRLEQGQLVLLSNDGRFPYQFACFACSSAPILLMSIDTGRFVNVTRRYPAAIAADAAAQMQAVREDLAHHTEVLGVVPAWVADECMLGRQAQAYATVDRMLRAGNFSPKLGPGFDGTGAAFVTNLHRFLIRTGYCH